MTRDDILRMAREAGIPFNKFGLVGCQNCEQYIDHNLERFAELIAAVERDACAEVCRQMARRTQDIRSAALQEAADNILARGAK